MKKGDPKKRGALIYKESIGDIVPHVTSPLGYYGMGENYTVETLKAGHSVEDHNKSFLLEWNRLTQGIKKTKGFFARKWGSAKNWFSRKV